MALEMKYFVLNPKAKIANDHHAFASRVAMHAYAKAIHRTDEELSCDLDNWAQRESNLALKLEIAEAKPLDLEDDGRVDSV